MNERLPILYGFNWFYNVTISTHEMKLRWAVDMTYENYMGLL
jgi:hypothetical protein